MALTCKVCKTQFSSWLGLWQHKRLHFQQRSYRCNFKKCIKTFSTLSQLQRHRRRHINRRIYQCKVCRLRFLLPQHRDLHRCHQWKNYIHRCHVCSSTFKHALSLSHHMQKDHSSYRQRRKEKYRSKCGKASGKACVAPGNTKVLLKITAGKSMTILTPSKKPSRDDTKRKRGKKRSKSKKRKKREDRSPVSSGIILSIKNGAVKLPEQRTNAKTISEKAPEPANGLVKTSYKVNDLKLCIKTRPDLIASPKREPVSVVNTIDDGVKTSIIKSSRTTSECELLDSETGDVKMNTNLVKEAETPPKVRNGIVIVKDKTGNFSAESLEKVKSKKKDRENVFDSLKDMGVWKVMPSPKPDRGTVDVLKLKLSPHKPIRIESSVVPSNNGSRYLDISMKAKGDISDEDLDMLEIMPVYDKESDKELNNVNDSGIEVLSSSSCNRSNGNSVHSVAMDENSPTYFNTEDSLLSLDSPYGYATNKEHSICHRCGGISYNSNTHSPGKCPCYLSNLNSPFHTPISPVKLSDVRNAHEISVAAVTTAESVQLNSDKGLTRTYDVSSDKTALTRTCSEQNASDEYSQTKGPVGRDTHFTKYETTEELCSDGEDSDIMVISMNHGNSSPKNEKDLKLKLKLRPKESSKSPSKSPVKNRTSESSQINSNKSPKKKESLSMNESPRKNLFVSLIEQCVKSKPKNVNTSQANGEKVVTNAVKTKHSEHKVSESIGSKCASPNPTILSTRCGTASSPVIIIGDDETVTNTKPSSVDASIPTTENKLSRKKPLFKSKRQISKSDETSPVLKIGESSASNLDISKSETSTASSIEKQPSIVNKKPLLKESVKKKTLFKKQRLSTECSVANTSVPVTENKTDTTNESNKQRPITETDTNSTKKGQLNEIELKDEDSLQGLSKSVVGDASDKPVENKTSDDDKNSSSANCSMDLFQKQFLSFLSNKLSTNTNEQVVSEDKSTVLKKSEASIIDVDTDKPMLKTDVTEKSQSTGSFSWLNIFSDGVKNNSNEVNDDADVMKGLSNDLLAINQKIDISDDDTNSLDMIDMFQVNIEPKLTTSKANSKKQSRSKSIEKVPEEKCKPEKSLKRPQTAKRTSGKFRTIKKKVELDYVYTNDSSGDETIDLYRNDANDPEFKPADSDDDFVVAPPAKRRASRACSLTKIRTPVSTRDPDDSDVGCQGDYDENSNDNNVHTARNRRLKQSRKSFCPCCISENDDKVSRQHRKGRNNKVSRTCKQFIKHTVRLLKIQEKLHTLFLTLFPDCGNMISCCKVGTDEFNTLIEDVLSTLEEPNASSNQSVPMAVDSIVPVIKTEPSECPENNIGLPFVSPDSGSRTSEIDFLVGGRLGTEVPDPSNPGLMWAGSSYNSTSTSVLKFENNTLADDDCSDANSSPAAHTDNHTETQSITKPLVLQIPSTQDSTQAISSSYQPLLTLTCVKSTSSVATVEGKCEDTAPCITATQLPETLGEGIHTSSFTSLSSTSTSVLDTMMPLPSSCENLKYNDSSGYSPTVAQQAVPTVNVTYIDLNAAKVSLCQNPKHCFQKLHGQIVRLAHNLLPELKFKKYFYRNVDNLEFFIDLLITVHTGKDVTAEPEVIEPTDLTTLQALDVTEGVVLPEPDAVAFSYIPTVTTPTTTADNELFTDTEPLLGKCPDQDMFEQEIKSQRESLKRDLFVIEEDNYIGSDMKVLHSLTSLNKIAQQRRSPRKRNRDGKPRKPSADEKRTLFVQDKIQNLHNSSFVCASSPKNPPETTTRKNSKQTHATNSKVHFLSELNLGDKPARNGEVKPTHNEVNELKLGPPSVNKVTGLGDNVVTALSVPVSDTVPAEKQIFNLATEEMDEDLFRKTSDKNIFELMFPV